MLEDDLEGEELPLEGPAAEVNDVLVDIEGGILNDLDLLRKGGPQGGRQFLRCRPNLALGQGELYSLQVGYYPGPAGRMRQSLEKLLGRPPQPPETEETP